MPCLVLYFSNEGYAAFVKLVCDNSTLTYVLSLTIFIHLSNFYCKPTKGFFQIEKMLLTILSASGILFWQGKSGCSAVGSVLDWGSRGRRFKSCHSDQLKPFFRWKERLFYYICNHKFYLWI